MMVNDGLSLLDFDKLNQQDHKQLTKVSYGQLMVHDGFAMVRTPDVLMNH